ncbi:hypothetical protein M404DRAFT_991594 [Pisolithus tinctorius Marx 270]|uniref:Uncharacterized protein n=1 Tax=Pisolithus tinctorius Marx 270 TaxID=870435 RepID=A0A0C3K0F4_PISTI|nr:hypothetical protein M404DRAFT_991594 [Pisolithus tinctorius Marx 270]
MDSNAVIIELKRQPSKDSRKCHGRDWPPRTSGRQIHLHMDPPLLLQMPFRMRTRLRAYDAFI